MLTKCIRDSNQHATNRKNSRDSDVKQSCVLGRLGSVCRVGRGGKEKGRNEQSKSEGDEGGAWAYNRKPPETEDSRIWASFLIVASVPVWMP